MSERLLLIECGAAETRAAFFEEGVLWRLWFGPPLDAPRDSWPIEVGHAYCGRVRRIDPSLKAAFVDIGEHSDGFLPLKNGDASLVEGQLITVRIKTPPRQRKGAQLSLIGEAESGASIGLFEQDLNPVERAIEAIGDEGCEIKIDHPIAARQLESAGREAHYATAPALFQQYGVSQEIDSACSRFAPLKSGGLLVFDEAEALTAIDIDSAAVGAGSSARLREKLANEAAREAIRQISLRNIGGHVVIDFPPLRSDGARERFQKGLRQSMARLRGAGRSGFAPTGLYTLSVTRRGLSLQEQASEPDETTLVPGRRFTSDWVAKAAIREIEQRLRDNPKIKVELSAGDAVFAYLAERDAWRRKLADQYGARFMINSDNKSKDRPYAIFERN